MAIVLENYNGARKLIATGAPQQEIDDSVIAPDRMWSSKKLIEISTSHFETTSNPVVVSPFAYSPLGVKINFTPKQSGTGDPSPQNVGPITGYDSLAVNARGKNLWNFTLSSSKDSWIIPFLPQGSYVLSVLNTGNWWTENPNGTEWFLRDSEDSQTLANVIFQSPEVGERCFAIFDVPYNGSFRLNAYVESVTDYVEENQLEAGSAPTPYEPYQPGTTATLTLPETIYGGTVDAVTGVGSKEWDIVTLTSDFLATNAWTYGTNGNQTSPVIYGEIPMANDEVGDIYCTHFKLADSVPIENLEYWSDSSYFGLKCIAIRNDEWTSLEAAKAWLDAQAAAGTHVQVAYKLATPSAFTSDGYKTIQPLEGVNTIYSNTDSVTVSGRTSWINLMEGGN